MPIFVIEARWTPEVLSRIVLLFHRRRVQIDSLLAEHDKKSDVLRIELKIEGDEGRVELIEANLYKLWDVMVVKRKDSEQPVTPRRKRGVVRET
jgi:acetolactate synthase small subunit